MHATVCLLRAGQPRWAGNAAKSGQFIGQFSWDEYVPTDVKGLNYRYSVSAGFGYSSLNNALHIFLVLVGFASFCHKVFAMPVIATGFIRSGKNLATLD